MKKNSSQKVPSQAFLVFSSAFLLALAFPKFGLSWTAWFSLVPGLILIRRIQTYRRSFMSFFSIGYVSFLMSVEWLRYVSFFGWLFVCGVCSLYFGAFGMIARYFLSGKRDGPAFLALPAAWVVLEWIRTEIPVWAFGWNLLGYSQSETLPIARLASWVGAYGVSFLIVYVNLAIWFLWETLAEGRGLGRALRRVLYALLLIVIVVFHFQRKEMEISVKPPSIDVAVIQGNIPQSQKWNPEVKTSIIEQYKSLSELVVSSRPNLVIWPEAAWPGILNLDPQKESILGFIRTAGVPFLIGSPYEEEQPPHTGRGRIFNSAHLIDENGNMAMRYDKIRLVPFGEFVPFASFFGFFGLEKYAYSLGVGDFSAGSEPTVFEIPNKNRIRFSTLICFEDTFPSLAQKFVARGAQFLVVITNDAWFMKSAAPYQHLQASVFRAIEQGVPVIRAANTGVSAFIHPDGRVMDRIRGPHGFDTWIAGGLVRPIPLTPQPTFYQEKGYFFPFFCAALVLFVLFVSIAWDRKRSEGRKP